MSAAHMGARSCAVFAAQDKVGAIIAALQERIR